MERKKGWREKKDGEEERKEGNKERREIRLKKMEKEEMYLDSVKTPVWTLVIH